MPELPQYQFRQGRQTGRVDTSQAQAWQTLSNTLGRFSQQMSQLADIETEEKFKALGTLEGAKGAPTLQEGYTIADLAYNRAAVTSYAASVGLEAKGAVGEIAAKYQYDPEGFQNEFDAALKGTLNGIQSPEIRVIAERKYREYGVIHSATILKNHKEKVLDEALANTNTALGALEIETYDAIRQGRTDFVALKQQEYAEAMGIAVQSNLLSATKAQERLQDYYDEIDVVTYVAGFNKELEEGRGWEFMQDFASAKELGISEDARSDALKRMEDLYNDWDKHQTRLEKDATAQLKADQEVNEATMTEALLSQQFTPEEFRYQLNQMRSQNLISPQGFTDLLKALKKGEAFTDDPDTEANLWEFMFDPSVDDSITRQAIVEARKDGLLTTDTMRAMLSEIRTGSLQDVTRSPDWKIAIDEIKREFQTTGPMAAFDTEEQTRISQANRELYRRVLDGEKPLEIIDEIKGKYAKKQAVRASKPAWLLGTDENPDWEATEQWLLENANASNDMDTFNARSKRLEAYRESWKARKAR